MTRNPVDSEAAFTRLLTSITDDTVTAAIHWRLWKDLKAAVPEFVRELNQSNAFWSLTFNAHRETSIFRLVRLYDQQKAALNLRGFVSLVSQNLHLFDQEPFRKRLEGNRFADDLAQTPRRPSADTLKEDAEVVGPLDPIVKRFIALRNRVIAHRDPFVVTGASADPASDVSAEDIEALLARAAMIVNRYGSLFHATTSLMSITGDDDFRNVLERVRRDIDNQERQIDAEIARLGAPNAG